MYFFLCWVAGCFYTFYSVTFVYYWKNQPTGTISFVRYVESYISRNKLDSLDKIKHIIHIHHPNGKEIHNSMNITIIRRIRVLKWYKLTVFWNTSWYYDELIQLLNIIFWLLQSKHKTIRLVVVVFLYRKKRHKLHGLLCLGNMKVLNFMFKIYHERFCKFLHNFFSHEIYTI